MNHEPYLLFTLDGLHYGLTAGVVQEIFFLPALTSVPESGPEVAGVLNLRGQLLPVLNLKVCLGKPRQRNTLNQAVILVRYDHQRLGLVVDDIQNVEEIATNDISNRLDTPYIGKAERSMTTGLAKFGNQIIILLNPETLVHGYAAIHEEVNPAELDRLDNTFMAQFSPDDQMVLRDRAAGMAQVAEDDNFSGLSALAVVSLEGEQFALGLESVHEFTEVPQITPIPCCPSHIVGNMNLRGEILTLVDVRRFLNLAPNVERKPDKAVVMRLGSLVAGVVVDEVYDVVYVQPTEIAAIPAAIHSSDNEYLKGIARYQDSMMSLLDLPRLLTQGELVVNQSG
ncbi:MAG: chemotaxis protein CheW [Leptolyngbya sp.]|nr:chemotaxis protein CheW [Leptolyngbya sp.]